MDDLRAVREQFLAADLARDNPELGTHEAGRLEHRDAADRQPMPRAEIATSWRRSQLVGVAPESTDLPYVSDAPTPRRLITAAAPVIDALVADFADTTGTVLLADRDVRILDRRVGTRSWMSNLDRNNVAPGFVFAEEYAGTNGLGCAMEEARLFEVRGAEHFRDTLQSFVCIAAPIRHPARRTVEGVLNLTCSLDEFSPLARVVLRRAVGDIEQRLLELGTRAERMLLDAFLTRSKRTTRALVAVGADVYICNPPAAELLERSDRDVLWYWAAPALSDRSEAADTIELTGGRSVDVRAMRVGEGSRTYGALIELHTVIVTPDERARPDDRGGAADRHDAAAQNAAVRRGAAAGGRALGSGGAFAASRARAQLGDTAADPDVRAATSGSSGAPTSLDQLGPGAVTGSSAPATALRAAIARATAAPGALLIAGELGSGRRRIARYILATATGTSTVTGTATTTGAATQVDARNPDWYAAAHTAVDAGEPLLLRNVQMLTDDPAPLRTLIELAERTNAPLVATTDEISPQLVGIFPQAIAVPPLRERHQDIRELAGELLAKIDPERALELHPAALRGLQQHDWPGNVRELQLTLSLAAQACIGRQIMRQHLPAALQSSERRLSPLEQAERDTILAALHEAGGNKRAAASVLGLARSTLYRKMRTLKIDGTAGF